MNVQSTTEEKVQVTLSPKTQSGKDAALDGVPSWNVESGDATLDVASDGLSAFLISADNAGTASIRVSADADLGEGVRTIELILDYTYTSPEAAALGATVGTPVPKA